MSLRKKKRLVSLVVTLVVVLIGLTTAEKVDLIQTPTVLEAGYYRVAQFEDGDTIIVDMDGTEEKVRFIGVDTPETKDPRKPVQCFGKAASQFTKSLIGAQPVRLEADPTNTNRDRYGRLLRYIYLPDGTLVNLEIIKQGYGFAYVGFPVQKMEEFRAAQTYARENNRGLWAGCTPTENKNGGWTSNDE